MKVKYGVRISCVLLLFPVLVVAAERPSGVEKSASPVQAAANDDDKILTLYLFVHPMPRRASIREEHMAKWEKLFATEGPKESNAICVLSNAPKEMELLRRLAKKYFGRRCIIDPSDNSPATRLLIAGDLERTLSQRGNLDQWVPYEIWTSNNARRWTEGLKKELGSRGLTYDPAGLRVVACGQQWTGCLTKYALFITKYLGAAKAADVRPELSPGAGFPFKATFRECLAMDRQVQLFLFETADGQPMGQFLDGLRGVWEAPHAATIPIDPAKVEIFTTTPNRYQQARHLHECSKIVTAGLVVDVGDGCRPVITTIIGRGISYDDFRASLAKATITPLLRAAAARVSNLPVGCADTLCPN